MAPAAMLGLIIITALLLVAVFAWPLSTFPRDVTNYDPPHRLLPPGSIYWFGTDRMGGDIYSRLLFGARLTILIAVGGEPVDAARRQQAMRRVVVGDIAGKG